MRGACAAVLAFAQSETELNRRQIPLGLIMSSILGVALPVFSVIAVGFLLGHFKLLDQSISSALNRFVFSAAMPAALFGLMVSTPPPGIGDLPLAGAYMLGILLTITIAFFTARIVFKLSIQESGAHMLGSSLGNAVFMGLPIALAIEGWARPYVILMLIEGIFVIGIAMAFITPPGPSNGPAQKIASALIRPFKNPLVLAVVLGGFLSATNLLPPAPIVASAKLLGQAAGPTALFSLGLFLATQRFPAIGSVIGPVASIAIAKMVILPTSALALLHIFGVVDTHAIGALALFTLVPCAVGCFIITSRFGVYVNQTAAAIALTTALSLISVPMVLWLFA